MTDIVKGMSMSDYRANLGLSQSTIKRAIKSIRHYLTPFGEPSPSMALGTALHTEILTPWERDYIVAPVCDRRKKEGKAIWANFQAEAEGKAIITQEQNTALGLMVQAVKGCFSASQILSAIDKKDREVSAFGGYRGLAVKGRADAIIESTCIDVKTTADASPEAFSKSIFYYGYDIQFALYNYLFDCDTDVIIAVENQAPFCCETYYLGDETLELGRKRLDICIDRIIEYQQTEEIKSYTDGKEPVELNAPRWAFFE